MKKKLPGVLRRIKKFLGCQKCFPRKSKAKMIAVSRVLCLLLLFLRRIQTSDQITTSLEPLCGDAEMAEIHRDVDLKYLRSTFCRKSSNPFLWTLGKVGSISVKSIEFFRRQGKLNDRLSLLVDGMIGFPTWNIPFSELDQILLSMEKNKRLTLRTILECRGFGGQIRKIKLDCYRAVYELKRVNDESYPEDIQLMVVEHSLFGTKIAPIGVIEDTSEKKRYWRKLNDEFRKERMPYLQSDAVPKSGTVSTLVPSTDENSSSSFDDSNATDSGSNVPSEDNKGTQEEGAEHIKPQETKSQDVATDTGDNHGADTKPEAKGPPAVRTLILLDPKKPPLGKSGNPE